MISKSLVFQQPVKKQEASLVSQKWKNMTVPGLAALL